MAKLLPKGTPIAGGVSTQIVGGLGCDGRFVDCVIRQAPK